MARTFDDTGPYVPKIRLYVQDSLQADGAVTTGPEQAHYLQHVMRCKPGQEIALFNGRDGEWLARIESLAKKQATLLPVSQSRPQISAPDLWLLFAPVKRGPFDFIVEKATELGVSRLMPVVTRFTVRDRVKMERMDAIAREAAEQCGRLDVPEVLEPRSLDDMLTRWPADRTLIFCDEGGAVRPMLEVVSALDTGPAALLIGPEGGFHKAERELLHSLPFVRAVSLGPRILRADTAALSALTLYQAAQGDWR
jgi:16S rRNA (uracil1498-N3)-methyltransferase